jgi:LysM repeat protein
MPINSDKDDKNSAGRSDANKVGNEELDEESKLIRQEFLARGLMGDGAPNIRQSQNSEDQIVRSRLSVGSTFHQKQLSTMLRQAQIDFRKVVNNPPDAANKPPAEPQIEIYLVKSGETLADIARNHNISLIRLATANPQIKNPDDLAPGQQINIPRASS